VEVVEKYTLEGADTTTLMNTCIKCIGPTHDLICQQTQSPY